MTANRPQPRPAAAPRRARHRGLCARQERGAWRCARVQAVRQRDAARAEPEGDRGLPGGRRPSAGLSGGHRPAAARGDRQAVRARSRAHRVRRRLRRSPESAWRRLPRRRRRGDLHHPRLHHLSDRDARRRREAGRRRGEGPYRRRRRHPRQGDRAHQDGVARQPEQSDRHLHSVRRVEASAALAAVACAAAGRRGLLRNTSGATTTRPASSWSRPATMS